MKTYHIKGETPFGYVDFEIPQIEVQKEKRRIKIEGYNTYDQMLNITSHPEATFRLNLFPGANRFLLALRLCFYVVRVGFVAAVIFLIMKLWIVAIVVGIFTFFVINGYLQTFLNYEIGSRLSVMDKYLDNYSQDKNANESIYQPDS